MNKTAGFILLLCPFWINAQPTIPDSTSRLLNPEMVLVEGGSYMMGLTRNETGQGFGSTNRTRRVTVSSFAIAKYEVTQAEWQSVMGDSSNLSLHQGCGRCPVEEVSWNDVQFFHS